MFDLCSFDETNFLYSLINLFNVSFGKKSFKYVVYNVGYQLMVKNYTIM